MKYLSFIIAAILLLFTVKASYATSVTNDVKAESDGENSSVNVNIKNNVNTGGTNTSTSKTQTNIDIHQTGNGTSKVNVNGKEYKVEGPGDLSVHEGNTESSESGQINKEEKDNDSEPIITSSPVPNNKPQTVGDLIKLQYEEIKRAIRRFFSSIFKRT